MNTIIPMPMVLPMGRSRCVDCRCPCHDEPDPTFRERTAFGKFISVAVVAVVLVIAGWGLSLLWRNGPMGCEGYSFLGCDSGDYFIATLISILGVIATALASWLGWSFGGIWASRPEAEVKPDA